MRLAASLVGVTLIFAQTAEPLGAQTFPERGAPPETGSVSSIVSAPQGSGPSSAAREAILAHLAGNGQVNLRQAVADALARTNLTLRTAARTRQDPTARPQSGGSPELRWAGIGMMLGGGLLALAGGVNTCGSVRGDYLTGVSVNTHPCWAHVAVGGGVAGAGWYLWNRNR